MSVFGLVLSVVGMIVGLVIVTGRLIYGSEWAVQGVFTLMAGLFFFMGVQLIGMGLLGEYIGRIYHDVRARPRYFVREVIGCHSELRVQGSASNDELLPTTQNSELLN